MNDNNDQQPNPWMKSLLIWAGILLALAAFVSVFDSRSTTASAKTDRIAYSDFIAVGHFAHDKVARKHHFLDRALIHLRNEIGIGDAISFGRCGC